MMQNWQRSPKGFLKMAAAVRSGSKEMFDYLWLFSKEEVIVVVVRIRVMAVVSSSE